MALVALFKGDFTGEQGTPYRWQISEEGGSFVANLKGAGRGFIQTTWTPSDRDEYAPLIVSETTLRVYDTDAGDLFSLLLGLLEGNSDSRYVFYIRDMSGGGFGTIIWRGYVTRGEVTKDEDGNSAIEVRAHDGLSLLKKTDFVSGDSLFGIFSTKLTGRVTYTSLLSTLLLKTNLGGNLHIASQHYPFLHGAALTANGGNQLSATQNPWDHVYVDRDRYRDKSRTDGEATRPIKSMDVLEDMLQTWGCTLFQWNGEWWVYQVNLRGNDPIRVWNYDQSGSPVGTPAYTDDSAHVVTPVTEAIERTIGRLGQLENYEAVRIDYNHGEFKFMPNPGFDFGGVGGSLISPFGWTIVGPHGARYENLGDGDGQLVVSSIKLDDVADMPTTPIGTGAGSVDKFIQDYADASVDALGGLTNAVTFEKVLELDNFTTGSHVGLGISGAYDGPVMPAGEVLWMGFDNGNLVPDEYVVLSADLRPGDTVVNFNLATLTGNSTGAMFAKKSGKASMSSQLEIGAGENVQVLAQFLPDPGVVSRFVIGPENRAETYIQVKLSGGSGTYYLNKAGGTTGLEWTTSVAWVTKEVTAGSWNIIDWRVLDDTPIQGTITITIGPPAEFAPVRGGGVLGPSGRRWNMDNIRWDNVTVRPILSPLFPNSEGRSILIGSSAQTTEAERTRSFSPMVGDAPVTPFDAGMSLDVDGFLETRSWEEAPITGAESNLSHEGLLGKVMLRSMRALREVHSATYFDAPALLGPYHVLSRNGAKYVPRQIDLNWVHEHTAGEWYKVTESGFTDESQVIRHNAAFVSSRGGVGDSAAGFFSAMGNVLFADGSGAITRTSATIEAGNVTSIEVESITEPIFKAGDLIAIIGPDLNFKQVRISADQQALATTLSIEDRDSPGSPVVFDEDMGFPAAIYFLEAELLTLARLGEQGFAVSVEGGPLGIVDGTQSGSLSSVTVRSWSTNLVAGASVWIDASNKVEAYGDAGLTRGMKRGDTTLYFDDAPMLLNLSDGQEILPEGATRRSEFKITNDAITSFIGNPGGVIATISGAPTFDGTNTSLPVSTTLSEGLVAGDPILVYAASGQVIKATVKTAVSAGATPIVLSDADGDQTSNMSSGDKTTAGSLTALRIDMSGISVTADQFSSTNYSPGSAGWAVFGDGSAEFQNVTVRGNIQITGGSGVSNLSDAGALATADDLDDVEDGVAKARWNKDGSPPFSADVDGAGLYVGNDNIGYYNGTAWKTFMSSAGDFFLTGTNGFLQWSAGTETLTIKGSIEVTGGSGISAFTDAGVLAGRDTVTGTHIDDNSISTPKLVTNAVTAAKIDVGDLFAQTITLTGSISGTGWSINGSAITMSAGSIDIGNFAVDTLGNLTATNVTLTGTINATSGTFSGSLNGATGTFSGDLSAAGGSFTGSLSAVTGSLGALSVTGALTLGAGGSIVSSSGTNDLSISQAGGIGLATGSGVSGSLAAGLLTLSNTVSAGTSVSANAASGGASVTVSGGTGNASISVSGATASISIGGNTVWHAGNDGAGSGLDADLLDGLSGSHYLSMANATGTLALSNGGTGASTASAARSNLGLGGLAVLNTLSLGDLSNVEGVGSPSNGAVLTYNSTIGAWTAA